DKPAGAVDACWQGGQEITDQNACRNLYPYFSNPRIVAGAPFANNVEKCRLEPLNRSSYNVTFTDAQWATMQKTFPTGACDYNLPAAGQQSSIPWESYANGPGGDPMGRAPRSAAFG